jgi:hypothetical protein
MEPVKVVLRYIDGRVHKGFTQNFYPNKDRFHLFPADKSSDVAKEVFIRDLKALFIVRDFTGDPSYDEQKNFSAGEKTLGRRVEVTFRDGEIIAGSTLGYDQKRNGFFIYPADPKSNNIRAFIISSAVRIVRQI